MIRGALIGVVETVPGVSGGTVALVVGIYHQLIRSASALVSAARSLITGPTAGDDAATRGAAARTHLQEVDWQIIVPVLIGMPIGLFSAVQLLSPAIENHPELTRAAFFGMVLASLAVPLRMAGKLAPKHWIAGLAAAALTWFLVSLPPTVTEPAWWVILPAAAVAVSALLLPGLSGSFLLLTFGLYEPTMAAARDFDLGYLGIFALGMLLGVVSIVKGLKWLLENHHTITMAVLAGVMLGALRTLWPWQTDGRDLLVPAENLPAALGLGAAGFAVVVLLVIIDARLAKKPEREFSAD